MKFRPEDVFFVESGVLDVFNGSCVGSSDENVRCTALTRVFVSLVWKKHHLFFMFFFSHRTIDIATIPPSPFWNESFASSKRSTCPAVYYLMIMHYSLEHRGPAPAVDGFARACYFLFSPACSRHHVFQRVKINKKRPSCASRLDLTKANANLHLMPAIYLRGRCRCMLID